MAGLYVHIPFCRSRCVYCGFYSTTGLALRQRYVDAVCREWQLRQHELTAPIETIYFGGGTPSQLTTEQLRQLFATLPNAGQEVTIEMNPDDVTAEYAEALRTLPVNRVSLGAQTFSDQRLRFLHRRHTVSQVGKAISRLRRVGISNISVDLMYGFPDETLTDWHEDISQALSLDVEHLSAYSLMYEEGTLLYSLSRQGKVAETDEELSRAMYDALIDRLTAVGYEHYELSNFARPGYRSRHNSSYWNDTPYIGLGAAAHSYHLKSRQWNVADIQQYIHSIEHNELPAEMEQIDEQTHYNERVMTALRTREGLFLNTLPKALRHYCEQQAKQFVETGLLRQQGNHLQLTRKGLFVSDMIMAELMHV